MTLLRNAWLGWLAMSGEGKLGALLLLILLLAWLWKLGNNERQKELFLYGGWMTVLCILPVSAVLFMLYQTKFYDYEWIWTLVPVTGLIACGGILIFEVIGGKVKSQKEKIFCIALAILIVLLCGRLGNPKWTVRDLKEERNAVQTTLQELEKIAGGPVLLWAPKEVMAHARSLDADIELIYGRNMWQEHLNAYSYDGYGQEQRDLYAWMSLACAYGKLDVTVPVDLDLVGEAPKAGSTLEGIACIRKAAELGVNYVLLPGTLSEEALEELEQALSIQPIKLGQYWLLSMEQKE